MPAFELGTLFKRRGASADSRGSEQHWDGLREVLGGWQIFFIGMSTVIGVTIFYSDGLALEIAGPGGSLLAFVVVGIVAICVTECVSELTQMFPTPNAISESVKVFVDEDLAWVIGIGYWYTWSSVFATQIIVAASFTDVWHFAPVYQTLFFYVLSAFAMIGINSAGVYVFGVVETIGGMLKISMVFICGVAMYAINSENDHGSQFLNKGIEANHRFVNNPQTATCFALPIIAYAFLGLESITVMAYEARDLPSIRKPSQYIAYFTLALYLFAAIGEYLNVSWLDQFLPVEYRNSIRRRETGDKSQIGPGAIAVVAAVEAGHESVAWAINGFMIFAALSAANSSLYISSRILYGMCRDIQPLSPFSGLRKIGCVWSKNGVPLRALWVSAIAFMWLPFLRLKGGQSISDLFDILSVTASVSCLIVWAAVCAAFLNYWRWFRMHKSFVRESYPEYDRKSRNAKAATFLEDLQPFPAIIGLVGTLLTIVFTTATWWDTKADIRVVAQSVGAPIVLLVLFTLSKIRTRNPLVKLSNDPAVFEKAIRDMRSAVDERNYRSTFRQNQTSAQDPEMARVEE